MKILLIIKSFELKLFLKKIYYILINLIHLYHYHFINIFLFQETYRNLIFDFQLVKNIILIYFFQYIFIIYYFE